MPENNIIDLKNVLEVAVDAATAGGDILTRYFRDGVSIRNKSDNGGKSYDLVSDADLESEQAIANHLAKHFPDHELLGEESLTQGRPDAEHLWVIDPLDGTNNFAHRLPHFAVSIAYYHQGEAQVGVVLNPIRDEWFTAVRGDGAKFNGVAVSVCNSNELNEVLIGCGFYYDRGAMMKRTLAAIEEFFSHDIHGIRRFGTASLDLCMVGLGQLGGFFEYQLSPWDFAAGRLFIEEAGGKITTAMGLPLEIQKTSVLASNGTLHDAMQEITSRH